MRGDRAVQSASVSVSFRVVEGSVQLGKETKKEMDMCTHSKFETVFRGDLMEAYVQFQASGDT